MDGTTCGRYGKMTTRRRNKLPASAFGLPGERKYPMPDPAHAKNAKARAKQQLKQGHLTKAQYARIVRKADRVINRCNTRGLGRGLGRASLVNVERRAAMSPSFRIADREERAHHHPGDLVKLIWEDPARGGERMWVRITDVTRDGRYRGELDNTPALLDDMAAGDEVSFGPENIADAWGTGSSALAAVAVGLLGGGAFYLLYRLFKA